MFKKLKDGRILRLIFLHYSYGIRQMGGKPLRGIFPVAVRIATSP